jgi:hypothetical protein
VRLKTVATCLLAIWVSLLGIEFSEDAGFFDYDDPDLDRSMEATLAGFGEAIKVPDNLGGCFSVLQLVSVPAAYAEVNFQSLSHEWPVELTPVLEKESLLYQRHNVLLL